MAKVEDTFKILEETRQRFHDTEQVDTYG